MAALAVEAVTKKRLGEFLQERLFAPLGMVDTGFVVPASKAARIAKPLPIDPETGRPAAFRLPVKPWRTTAAVAARRERPSTTFDSPRCSSTTERSTGRAS